jgi:carbamoyltransferase
VSLRTGFRNLYVPPAPSDDGNAVGAALLAYRQEHPQPPPRSARAIHSPFLGSAIDTKELGQFAANAAMLGHVSVAQDEISDYVAEALAQGCIVGWVQGRAEFGPRSLGNRSILADPRDATMKDRINAIVKFREGFRPFAPSILDEYGNEYFEDYSFTPYMEKTLKIRPHLRERIPAVCHVDGTGRLQSVTAGLNPRFHALIEAFRRRTGVPVVLNTSLNVMGKPIVHSAADAVGIYLSSHIDMLVIDDLVFRKTPARSGGRSSGACTRANTPETAVPGAADTLGV